jgi:hypothetical protein
LHYKGHGRKHSGAALVVARLAVLVHFVLTPRHLVDGLRGEREG